MQKFFEALGSFVEERSVYFAPRIGGLLFTPPVNSHLVGYFEPGQPHLLYVRLKPALGLAKKFWASMDENLDMRVDAIRRQISQVPDLLFEQDQRQVEVSKRCAGRNQRVLAVDARVVENLYHVSLAAYEASTE